MRNRQHPRAHLLAARVFGSRFRAAILAACAAALAPALAAQQQYTITDLGVIPNIGTAATGDTDSSAAAISASGAVVGVSGVYDTSYAQLGFLTPHAFLWTPNTPNGTSGSMRYLGALPGNPCLDSFILNGVQQHSGQLVTLDTVATSVNGNNQAVGSSFTLSDWSWDQSVIHAALYGNGGVADLGVPPGIYPITRIPLYFNSFARSINKNGLIAGYAVDRDNTKWDAWLYNNGAFTVLGSIPG